MKYRKDAIDAFLLVSLGALLLSWALFFLARATFILKETISG